RERVVGRGHAVVGVGAQRDRDRVVAHVGVLHGGGCQRVVERVAVDRAGDRGGQGRVVIAVGLRLVVGGHGGGLPADRERVVGRGHAVVGVGAQRDRDRVVAYVGVLHGGGCQRVVERVAVDRAGDRGGQGRVVIAVGLRLVVGGHGGGLPADRERVVG